MPQGVKMPRWGRLSIWAWALFVAATIGIALLLGLTPPAHALAPFMQGGAVSPPLPTQSIVPQPSAGFSSDNGVNGTSTNNLLELNGNGTGPMLVPATVTNSWQFTISFQVDPISTFSGQVPQAVASSCASAPACSGGGDRVMVINPPVRSTGTSARAPNSINFQAAIGGQHWWQALAAKSVAATPGSSYTGGGGVYAWTATGGGCLIEPNGIVTIGTTITLPIVINPGMGCTGTPTVAIPAGGGAGTGGAITLTMSNNQQDFTGVGIVASGPGEFVKCWVGQYGQEPANVTAGINGQQWMACNDRGTGAPLTNSPARSTTTNQASSGAGFYYASLNTPRTQAAIADLITRLGSGFNAANTFGNGFGGSISNVAMIYGIFPNVAGVPDATTLSNFATGKLDLATWAAGLGFTVHSNYKLNDGTASPPWQDSSPSAYSAATVVGSVSPSLAITPPSCLRLTELGQGYTHGVQAGQTTGSVYILGTYDAACLGGNPSGIDAELTSGPNGTGTVIAAWQEIARKPSGGMFLGSIPGIAPRGNIYVSIRPHNGKGFVYASSQEQRVGFVVVTGGQSQVCYRNNPSQTGNVLQVASELLSVLGIANVGIGLADGTSNVPTSVAAVRNLDVASTPASSANAIGDGLLAEMKADSVRLGGWPVMYVIICKPGQPIDAWVYDYAKTSLAMTGSGAGPYTVSAGLQILQFIAGAQFSSCASTGCPGGQSLNPQSVKQGTVSIVDSTGATIATDVPGLVAATGGWGITAASTGTLTGSAIASGTINYLTGAITATFTGTPSTPLTVKFQSVIDDGAGTTAQNVPYVGFGVMGDTVTANSGMVTKVLLQLVGPPSLIEWGQFTANEGEFQYLLNTTNYLAGQTSFVNKTNYFFNTVLPKFSWWNSSIPIVITGYPRDVEPLAAGAANFYETSAGKQVLQLYGASGGQLHYGCSFPDVAVQGAAGPHPDNTVFGGQRTGRRASYAVVYVFQNPTKNCDEPTIASAALNGGHTQITIQVNLSAGLSIAICGTSLSSGTCTATNAIGTVVHGFRIGGAIGNGMLYEDGFDPVIGNNASLLGVDAGFKCTIGASNTIVCAKNSGTWPSGTLVAYLDGGPFDRFQSLSNIAGGQAVNAVTLSAGGTGYTNGNPIVATTGGTCTTQPKLIFEVAGGIITNAQVYIPGNCTVLPTVVLPSGGTGATVTIRLQTQNDDLNQMGTQVYDTRGGFGTLPGGGEPGLPITPLINPIMASGFTRRSGRGRPANDNKGPATLTGQGAGQENRAVA